MGRGGRGKRGGRGWLLLLTRRLGERRKPPASTGTECRPRESGATASACCYVDIDQGSMTVWKNDEKLGVMVAEGLSGPLCWAVEAIDPTGGRGESARIESAPAPASPTAEELAAAKVWQVVHPPYAYDDE